VKLCTDQSSIPTDRNNPTDKANGKQQTAKRKQKTEKIKSHLFFLLFSLSAGLFLSVGE
jgi:hypothetical protein